MLSLKVSWKFLIKNKLQNILIFLTIFVGIAAHFFVLSLSGILKNIIVEQSTLYLDHISIRLKRHSFYQNIDLEILNELEQIENVKHATYFVHLIGHVTKRNGERLPFYMRAISDYGYKGTYQEIYGVGLEENLVRGTINNPNKYEIMINDAFALENNINIGDEISFYNNYTNITVKLTVTGTYDTGQIGFLYNDGFLSESLFPFNNLTTNHINITVHDFSKTNETVAEIERLFGNDIQNVSSIYSQFETVNSLNVTQRLIVLVIEILMSITVFVIVSNLLSYIIQSKYHEIGILRASGLKNNKVRQIFVLLTLIITVVASILGLIVGRFSLCLFQKYMKDYYYQKPMFNYEVKFINYFYTFILMIFINYLASIFSFRKVKNESIVDLIKM